MKAVRQSGSVMRCEQGGAVPTLIKALHAAKWPFFAALCNPVKPLSSWQNHVLGQNLAGFRECIGVGT